MLPFGRINAQENVTETENRIWSVKIEGNRSFEGLVIKNNIANEGPSFWQKINIFKKTGTSIDKTEIRKDVIRIERFYQRRGYVDVQVSYELRARRKEWKKDLVFIVKENTPVRIAKVTLQTNASEADSAAIFGGNKFKRELNRIPYREGEVYQPIEEAEVLGRLIRVIKNKGYAYADLQIDARVDTSDRKAVIEFIADPGPQTRFDSIIVDGESTIDKEVVKRETGIKKGELYSEQAMRQAQREVFKHHLFRLALVSIPDQPKDSTLEIALRVKELPLRSLQLKLGIGDFDRLEEPIAWNNSWKLFRGQGTWVYRNVRGKGERFSVTGKYSFFEQNLSADYLFPYVYNTKSSISINPYYQRRDERAYNIETGGIQSTYGYEYNEFTTGTFSYQFSLNNETELRGSTTIPDSLLSYDKSSFAFNLYYARGVRRGNNGIIIQPYLELSGLFGEASFSFQKVSLDVRKYFELNSKLTLATRIRGGAIYYSKQDSLPSDIRFYSGGTNTVRGWGRQQLGPKRLVVETDTSGAGQVNTYSYVPEGGNAVLNFNVELRQQLDSFIKGFGVAAFLDGGQVWRRMSDINSGDIQFGVGGGLRYRSPIGPIRVDVGYKVNPTNEDLNIVKGVDRGNIWDRWGIHFSIGQAF
ncbi:MAG TPA: hypothetical protein DEQ34_12935 [Balneolaceae bacterium]|nr:hypothetical protein [Balneolaceae bacterium]|tara:strand:+ start:117011 stop:118939 length:1929 start_codon:yes stop_codon:yes gene_type:complete